MHEADQKDLQSVLLDPLERSRILLLPDIFDQCTPAGIHRTLHSLGSLSAQSDILPNVQERARFEKGLCGCQRIR